MGRSIYMESPPSGTPSPPFFDVQLPDCQRFNTFTFVLSESPNVHTHTPHVRGANSRLRERGASLAHPLAGLFITHVCTPIRAQEAISRTHIRGWQSRTCTPTHKPAQAVLRSHNAGARPCVRGVWVVAQRAPKCVRHARSMAREASPCA